MMNEKLLKIVRFVLIVLLVASLIWWINKVGIEQIRANIEQFGIWVPVVLLMLRMVSIVIPALPGTVYSVLAGGLLGFSVGLVVICLADLISCSISFFLSRRYGRKLVQTMVGEKFIDRVDRLSEKHLENNFFLLSGFLMTGFFDFVCYGAGLTKIEWRKFMLALVISILVSNPPIVALGAGVLEGGKMLLGFALLGTFTLAIITGFLRKNQKVDL
ncbi:MAG: VTT domain-containing protein [Prochloraceae cyanobacterium]|nr:VTT domain-containing protein [Prochloraceae cyanobacterium]